ncbi:protein-L-isoaspartate O-methyltransferase [Aquabacterium sp. J223]|uniref:protein-L-isoaspartate O-methyltransferase family protein n=1 Tax=Aquabacterium sp. J223 TaxID=2898431 RepID=UPI0021AD7376|nr:protein-L-isoaspartate O-methyltransferase [Aquabacterium sp. J223]UUX95043.1 protein-L-isoaspartate O-methyltransferase [Aquabacterium sp. J223]
MDIERARFNMIEQQIRPWDVLDDGVLSLLEVVKREEFVPAAYRALAFVDTEVPLPEGECMLAPKVEARLLQALKLQRHERVLEVGTGSGHMAALLGHKALQVHSMEIKPTLAQLARDNLRRAGVQNVAVHEADGAAGLAEEAPFDAILLSGSVARVPAALLDQLKPGGRLVGIVGTEPIMRAVRIDRGADDRFETVELFDTVAQRLIGFEEPPRFKF